MSEACCTCAALLSSIPPTYDEKTEKPTQFERRLECCGRAICARCLTDNPRFVDYCPFCQIATGPSPLPPQGLSEPPTYSPPDEQADDELPAYSAHNSLQPPPEKPTSSSENAPDVLHFVDPNNDTISSLSLRYGVPADALRRTNKMYADHLLAARRTILIPGEFYKGGVSLSPRPLEGEEEEMKKTKLRKFMVTCKVSEYDVALLYLEQANYNLEQATSAYKADEKWEQDHPLQAAKQGKAKASPSTGRRKPPTTGAGLDTLCPTRRLFESQTTSATLRVRANYTLNNTVSNARVTKTQTIQSRSKTTGASSVIELGATRENGRIFIDKLSNKRYYEIHPSKYPSNLAPLPDWRKPKKTEHLFRKASEKVVLKSLTGTNISPIDTQVSSRKGCSFVTSYSFKDTKEGETTAIYAPGNPPLYKKPHKDEFPIEIPTDKGQYYIDEHAGRCPGYQYLPMLLSILVTNPNFRFDKQKINVVVNRSSLEQLIKFIKGAPDQPYHLELTIEGDTLFIGKKGSFKGSSAKGSCGRNFEKWLTTEDPDLENATGHHCFIKYQFGDLVMIVRFEVDAYIAEEDVPEDADLPPCHYPDVPEPALPAVELEHSLCTVIPKGTLVKQEQLKELKSGVQKRPLQELWFGRTPNILVGGKGQYNEEDGGYATYVWQRFKDEYVTQKGDKDFEDWEQDQQGKNAQAPNEYLERLAKLLHKLIETTNEAKDRSAVLVCMGVVKTLDVYEAKERIEVAPKDIIAKFWSKDSER